MSPPWRRPMWRPVAFSRRLDLDDVRAMVRHHHRQMRPRQELRQIDDTVALEFHVRPTAPRRRAARSARTRTSPLAQQRVGVGAERRADRPGSRCPSILMGLASVLKLARAGCGVSESSRFAAGTGCRVHCPGRERARQAVRRETCSASAPSCRGQQLIQKYCECVPILASERGRLESRVPGQPVVCKQPAAAPARISVSYT